MRLSVRKGEGKSNLFQRVVQGASAGVLGGFWARELLGVGHPLIPPALPLACKAVLLLRGIFQLLLGIRGCELVGMRVELQRDTQCRPEQQHQRPLHQDGVLGTQQGDKDL